MTRVVDIDYRLTLRPRAYLGGMPFDLTPWVESLTRQKTLRGNSAGSWSAALCFGDDHWSREAERIFRAYVEDDDWGELEIVDRVSGDRSVWEIMVDAKNAAEVHAESAAAGRDYTITGRDWSKCMTDGEVRLGAVFQNASTTQVGTITMGYSEGSSPFISGYQELMTVMNEVVIPPRMPGFVDWKNWDELMKAAASGAALGMTASVPLKKILGILLWGMWKDADGTTLLQKLNEHGWAQFGPVLGCPWQLMNLTSRLTVTPDQVLRQFGNEHFNEVIYTTDGGPHGWPRIIYRMKPFLPRQWSALPVTELMSDGRILTVQLSQSGAERLTYYRPQAAVAGIQGLDIIIDIRTGRLPIVERSQLAYHGVRPGEPPDDLWPPADRNSEPMLEWYRRRIGLYRRWYYWNPQYLSGTVRITPADPRVRVGERVLIPFEWDFRVGDRVISTSVVEAYVTDVADEVHEGTEGRETQTTVTVVRGQPPGGLPVPAVERWTSGATRLVSAKLYDGDVNSVDENIQVYGVLCPVEGGYAVHHADGIKAFGVGNLYRARTADVTHAFIHHTDGDNGYPPTTMQAWMKAFRDHGTQASTHFLIDHQGDIWQLMDAGDDVSFGVATGAADYNSTAINIDFMAKSTGGSRPITEPQWGAFAALLRALRDAVDVSGAALLPALAMNTFLFRNGPTETPAAWATRVGVSLAALPNGVYGHGQVQANRSDPTVPAWDQGPLGDQGTWGRIQAIVAGLT